jgi:LmbE family N-acetylglucosaminyl deacetylase
VLRLFSASYQIMNILVIAPHPDDEVIGCGGSLIKYTRRGDRVVAIFLTSGELGLKHLARESAWQIRETEAKKCAKILGIAAIHFLRLPDWTAGDHIKDGGARLVPILKQEQPEIIYLPHPQEWHPDHQAALTILKAARRSGRGFRSPQGRGYEVWTPITRYEHVENITAEFPSKVRALRAYRSQLDGFDYERAVRGLNQFRGALAGRCRFAEVFQQIPL